MFGWLRRKVGRDLVYCEDCKWFCPSLKDDIDHRQEYSRCAAPRADKAVVRGAGVAFCDLARGNSGDCGPDARLFVPNQETSE